jgi:hypothetical protein
MKFKKFIILNLLFIIMFSGACTNATAFGDVAHNLPEQLGYMIYEEAVQFYGKPDWVTPMPKGGFYALWVRPGVVMDESLKLTFDANQVMRAYDYYQHPLGADTPQQN